MRCLVGMMLVDGGVACWYSERRLSTGGIVVSLGS
jgi:hypothetical protein